MKTCPSCKNTGTNWMNAKCYCLRDRERKFFYEQNKSIVYRCIECDSELIKYYSLFASCGHGYECKKCPGTWVKL